MSKRGMRVDWKTAFQKHLTMLGDYWVGNADLHKMPLDPEEKRRFTARSKALKDQEAEIERTLVRANHVRATSKREDLVVDYCLVMQWLIKHQSTFILEERLEIASLCCEINVWFRMPWCRSLQRKSRSLSGSPVNKHRLSYVRAPMIGWLPYAMPICGGTAEIRSIRLSPMIAPTIFLNVFMPGAFACGAIRFAAEAGGSSGRIGVSAGRLPMRCAGTCPNRKV
ncbi:hypothetical protein NBRC111894_922 [Sporolactobacillus inulinus]|uniref:Uncharacterized protein n=1 Tax=Sporolactobacillus inulinus TaxID=2078 RepID=A0A4Y1Z903_9BACL|nr:hypothetical protein NBRC111894_922 [Sporolactobacillus inulinus]